MALSTTTLVNTYTGLSVLPKSGLEPAQKPASGFPVRALHGSGDQLWALLCLSNSLPERILHGPLTRQLSVCDPHCDPTCPETFSSVWPVRDHVMQQHAWLSCLKQSGPILAVRLCHLAQR